MLLRFVSGPWTTIVLLVGLLLCNDLACAQSSGSSDKELLLTLARPGEMLDVRDRWGDGVDEILSLPPLGSRDVFQDDDDGVGVGLPFRHDVSNSVQARGTFRSLTRPEDLFPGTNSLNRLHGELVKLASLGPGWCAVSKDGEAVLDAPESFAAVGKLVEDASNVFSRLEIRVEKNAFRLRLFGVKENGDRTQLFECKTGLGSAEYPTPRGSYFILRIFDDNPLWIPPPDRPWAWGQAPSHSVYGGHMMPFFSKKDLDTRNQAKAIRDLDCVEGRMQMVDAGAYRIHGTNSPWSVGSGQSHGCVRLLNSSVKDLADLLKLYVGTTMRGRTANGSFVKLAKPGTADPLLREADIVGSESRSGLCVSIVAPSSCESQRRDTLPTTACRGDILQESRCDPVRGAVHVSPPVAGPWSL